jgi:hypothetical protein
MKVVDRAGSYQQPPAPYSKKREGEKRKREGKENRRVLS